MIGTGLCEPVFDEDFGSCPTNRAERTGLRSNRCLLLDRRGVEDGLEGSAEEGSVLRKVDGKGPSPKAERMGFKSISGGAATVPGVAVVVIPKDCDDVICPPENEEVDI